MAVALTQEGAFGFALQTERGAYASPTVWVPLVNDDDPEGVFVRWRRNYTVLDMGDGNDFQSRYFAASSWLEGRVVVPLVPGSMTALISWIQDRDQDNQGKWASLIVDHVNAVQKATDVKVRRARLVLRKGCPAHVVLWLVGLKVEDGSPSAVNVPTATPYQFGEASFEVASNGKALEGDDAIEELIVDLDNAIEDPAVSAPQHLYNLAGVRARGRVVRDFVDSVLHADFMGGQEAALRLALTRGASICSLCLPRLLYVAEDLGLPAAGARRIMQTIDFVALGSLDGLTAPVVLA